MNINDCLKVYATTGYTLLNAFGGGSLAPMSESPYTRTRPETNTCTTVTTHLPTQMSVSAIYHCRHQITPGISIGAGQKYRYRKYR